MPRLLTAVVLALALASPMYAADWPQWRGPARDGVSRDTGLLKAWPKDGPPLRWKASDIGTGYSSPSIVEGHVYVQTTRGNDGSHGPSSNASTSSGATSRAARARCAATLRPAC